jgi:hypothetical protein
VTNEEFNKIVPEDFLKKETWLKYKDQKYLLRGVTRSYNTADHWSTITVRLGDLNNDISVSEISPWSEPTKLEQVSEPNSDTKNCDVTSENVYELVMDCRDSNERSGVMEPVEWPKSPHGLVLLIQKHLKMYPGFRITPRLRAHNGSRSHSSIPIETEDAKRESKYDILKELIQARIDHAKEIASTSKYPGDLTGIGWQIEAWEDVMKDIEQLEMVLVES